MIYFFQKIWLILVTMAVLVRRSLITFGLKMSIMVSVASEWSPPKSNALIMCIGAVLAPFAPIMFPRQLFFIYIAEAVNNYLIECTRLRALREYRRARWAYAGKGFQDHVSVYLRYNRRYGHVVVAGYILSSAILGAIIMLLAIVLISYYGG